MGPPSFSMRGCTQAQILIEWGASSPLGAPVLSGPQNIQRLGRWLSDSLALSRLMIPLLTELLFFTCSMKRENHGNREGTSIETQTYTEVFDHLSLGWWETAQIFYLWFLSNDIYLLIHMVTLSNLSQILSGQLATIKGPTLQDTSKSQ